MAYRKQIEITPSTITDLTVVVKDDTFFTTLTLDDFTLSDNILTGNLTVSNNNAPISIYSQGYEPIITTFGDLSNSITLTQTSDYIKTSDGTNNYYVKDNYSRKFGNDLLDIVMTKADSSDIPDVSTKQDTLVSGTNIKTINNTSILGSGNIDVADIDLSNLSTTGQAVIDGKADTDLSNLSTTGRKVLYSKPTISRIAIVTEASQHKDIRTYSLANYLPNDGSDYLVQISCRVVTASTSGTFMNCNLTSSLQTNGVQFCGVRTRSNSFVETSGCGWMLIGSDRKLYHNGSDSNNYKGTYDIQAMAYIRVGSNS